MGGESGARCFSGLDWDLDEKYGIRKAKYWLDNEILAVTNTKEQKERDITTKGMKWWGQPKEESGLGIIEEKKAYK